MNNIVGVIIVIDWANAKIDGSPNDWTKTDDIGEKGEFGCVAKCDDGIHYCCGDDAY